MDFTKLIMTPRGTYFYRGASSMEMSILGCFFSSDVRCDDSDSLKQWALVSTDGDASGGNCIALEKENDSILLSDDYSLEAVPTKLQMTTDQFVRLFDEWQEKVIMLRPREVTIKHEHGQFFIETGD